MADAGINGAQATSYSQPGFGGPGGQASNSIGDYLQPGTNGSNAGNPYGGNGGGAGNGGAGGFGGGFAPNGNGYPGSAPGGGGGGGATGSSYSGGPGGNGQVVITYGGSSSATYSITGQVTTSGIGLRGVSISLAGTQTATVTTDANGNYSFFNRAANGNYTLAASKPGYAFSAAQVFPNLTANQFANFTATVSSASDFSLGISPASATVVAGGSTAYTVTVTPVNGFSGAVSLTAAGLPQGVTCNCPLTVTVQGSPATASLTISTTAAVRPGIYAIAFTGTTSGGLSRNGAASLVVQAAPDFYVTADPSFRETTPGTPVSYTLRLVPLNGWNEDVALTRGVANPPECPASLVVPFGPGSFVPDKLVPGVATTVTLAYSQFNYGCLPLRTLGRPVNLFLSSEAASNFTLRTPLSQTVTAPATINYSVTIEPIHDFIGNVYFNQVPNLPAGVTAAFSPNPLLVNGGNASANLNLSIPEGTTPGTYAIAITAVSGLSQHTAYTYVTVQGGADFSVTPASSVQSLQPTGTARNMVLVSSHGGFNGPVSLSVEGLPGGITYSLSPSTISGSGSSEMTLTSYDAPVGSHVVTIRASSAGSNHITQVEVIVQPTMCTPGPNWNCYRVPAEINFYNNGGTDYGLGAAIESYMDGFDLSGYFSVVSGCKKSFALPGSSVFTVIDTIPTAYASGGNRARCPATTWNPSRGTYRLEAFHSFTNNGAPVSLAGYIPPTPPAPAIRQFDGASGYDRYDVQVDLKLAVPGVETNPSTNTVLISNCTAPVVVEATFTPNSGVVLPVNWIGGEPGTDGLHRVVQCTSGSTEITACFRPNSMTSTTSCQGSNLVAQLNVIVKPLIMLEKVGDTVIRPDNQYSEDTTIRVTAVDSAGATITSFTGRVEIMELGTDIYGQNGGYLPPFVEITNGGSVTFVARSLSGPVNDAAPPADAVITSSNFGVFEGHSLLVPQWIRSGRKIDPRSDPNVYDWLQYRMKDIFAKYANDPDVNMLLNAIRSFDASYLEGADAITHWDRSATSPITINPFRGTIRIDGASGGGCTLAPTLKTLTRTVLHEGRHAYQASLTVPAGNDIDFDFLPRSGAVGIAPYNTIVDTNDTRTVCNQHTDELHQKFYRGDATYDSDGPPDFASYAREYDAWVFSSTHVK